MLPTLRYWLVAVQAVFVLALAAVSARPIPFEYSRPLTAALMIWWVGLLFLACRTAIVGVKPDRPLTSLMLSLRGELPTLSKAFGCALLIGLAMALHGWAKTMIPHVGGYWADPMLADLDHWLFGQDPWRLFQVEALGPLFAKIYVTWFPVTFGMMGLLAFSKRDHSVLLTAFVATLIIVGTIGQYVLPSAGPIFYERIGLGPRFNELVASTDPSVTFLADYLWRNYQAGGANLGTGISAMPSLHVTMAVWTMFAAHALWRPLVIPAAIYALIIYVYSVASGWHYATDGLVGAALAAAIYAWLSKRARRSGDAIGEIEPAPAGALASPVSGGCRTARRPGRPACAARTGFRRSPAPGRKPVTSGLALRWE
jgi:hypothetical protein